MIYLRAALVVCAVVAGSGTSVITFSVALSSGRQPLSISTHAPPRSMTGQLCAVQPTFPSLTG